MDVEEEKSEGKPKMARLVVLLRGLHSGARSVRDLRRS
jgi:hypothetical protein